MTQYINDRLFRKLFSRPSAPFPAQMNVAGQHDHVGISRRNFWVRSKFQVQVGEDMQAHVRV